MSAAFGIGLIGSGEVGGILRAGTRKGRLIEGTTPIGPLRHRKAEALAGVMNLQSRRDTVGIICYS